MRRHRPSVAVCCLLLLPATLVALASCTTGGGGGFSSAGGPAAGTVGAMNAGAFDTVVLDPGHGGHDSGGTGHGLREKDLTLDTALRLRDELQRDGLRVVMTRTDDRFVELDDRVALANRYAGRGAVVVSLHYDAVGGSSANGGQTFYWHPTAHGLATRIQRSFSREAGLANVGINRRRLRLTRNPDVPAVLVECAFLTNGADAARVAQPAERQRLAAGIAAGIAEQRRLGDAGIASVPFIPSPPSRPTDPRSGGAREQVALNN